MSPAMGPETECTQSQSTNFDYNVKIKCHGTSHTYDHARLKKFVSLDWVLGHH